jgi:hypothetical protein
MALFLYLDLMIYQIMRTTVTQLLREFSKVRRAAMRGDRVIISTRQGNLVLTKETSSTAGLMGSLRHLATDVGVDVYEHLFSAREWNRKKRNFMEIFTLRSGF